VNHLRAFFQILLYKVPEGNQHDCIHRRYPNVAILMPKSMGRACGGLCSICQRMYGFQYGDLNFDFEKLRTDSKGKTGHQASGLSSHENPGRSCENPCRIQRKSIQSRDSTICFPDPFSIAHGNYP